MNLRQSILEYAVSIGRDKQEVANSLPATIDKQGLWILSDSPSKTKQRISNLEKKFEGIVAVGIHQDVVLEEFILSGHLPQLVYDEGNILREEDSGFVSIQTPLSLKKLWKNASVPTPTSFHIASSIKKMYKASLKK